jgi:His/Glu/Gln/Arg/opine family amino acid ABC transporter permease subunit
MSTEAAEAASPQDGAVTSAPDTRGSSSPFARLIFITGAVALALVLVGTVAIQVVYALSHEPDPQVCLARYGIIPFQPATATGPPHGIQGWQGVCNIVLGLTSSAEQAVLIAGIVIGAAASLVGWRTYRRADTRRKRDHVITGAVLGLQAVTFGTVLWIFVQAPQKFVLQFMNFYKLQGHDGWALINGIKFTLLLAFGGEIGGILIGLLLALLEISDRRAVRAPATVYINVFRGTPLLVQLSIGYFGVNLGLGLHLSSFTVAIAIFALNMGAYSAEVFRAGIQSIERGQMEAARSVGMTYLQAMRYAIVPQAVRRVIPPLLNEFVILIKDTSLVAILGLYLNQLDLFSAAQQGYTSTFSATFYLAVAIGYLIITLPMIWIVNRVERRLRSGLVGITGGGA